MKIIRLAFDLVFINPFLNLIKIARNFRPRKSGKTAEQILGIAASEAREADIEKLGGAELMQLFYAARAPSFETMRGEFRAKIAGSGAHRNVAETITHHVFGFGTGNWTGKAFRPLGKNKGEGYNLFVKRDKAGSEVVERLKKMDTHIGKSNLDEKDSFHLHYAPHNALCLSPALSTHFMHDEVRQINDNLFICMGYSTQQWASLLSPGGGTLNPAPFILIGPPSEWVGI